MKRDCANFFEPPAIGEYPVQRLAAMHDKRQARIDGERKLKIPDSKLFIHEGAKFRAIRIKSALPDCGNPVCLRKFFKKLPLFLHGFLRMDTERKNNPAGKTPGKIFLPQKFLMVVSRSAQNHIGINRRFLSRIVKKIKKMDMRVGIHILMYYIAKGDFPVTRK